VIGWKSCLLWTAHTPCGINSLRKSNQIKSRPPILESQFYGGQDFLIPP
jgi:hypothetical protein